jgi:hypothetical protein
MTVLSVHDIGGTTGSSVGLQSEYERHFEVRTSVATDSENVVGPAVGIAYLDPHPTNWFARCTEIEVTQDSTNPTFWHARAKYKTLTRTSEQEQRANEQNPTKRKIRISGNWENIRVPVPADRDGKIIKNSAGQVPDPRPEADAYLSNYHFEADVFPLPDWVDTYRGRYGCINDALFKIVLESDQTITVKNGCAKLHGVRHSNLQYENEFPFFGLNFDLTLRDAPFTDTTKEGWVYDFVDSGLMQLPDDTSSARFTNATTDASSLVLSFVSTFGVQVGMDVSGYGIEINTTVLSKTDTTVTLSLVTSSFSVASGNTIYFTTRGTAKLEHIQDMYLQPVTSAVLLNGSGRAIKDPTTTDPVILYKNIYALKDFSILPGCKAS